MTGVESTEETKSMDNLTIDDNDPEMSLEERMNWLRERGVQVETAEERKRQQVVAAMKQAESIQNENTEVFYVLIPADSSKPLQELSFHPDTTKIRGDALIDHLKPEFSKKIDETIDIELLRQQQTQTLAATGGVQLPTVSDTTIRNVSEQASVETFTVVHPTPMNHYTSIVLYLDEVGMMKRLPLNKRATDYCSRAGFNPAPIFYGNIYIGRIQQKPQIRNISFRLGQDTSYDAPWLLAAMSTNLQYQQELNQYTGQKDVHQAGVAGSDGQIQQEDGYSWTQTEQEIEVIVPLPLDATSKSVIVKFNPLQLNVTYQKEVNITLPLFERVDIDSCTWTIENGSVDNGTTKRLVITMEKLEEAYWPRIRD